MEGFDLSVHGLALTFQENFYRKAYPLQSVAKPPSVDDFLRELRCANCNNLALPTFTQCQKDAKDFHLICDSCATKSTSGCPVITENKAAACGNKLVGFEKGLPRHIHQIIQQWQLPRGCRAKQYGCTFIGTATELQQHEKFNCTFRKLHVCFQPSNTGTGASCGYVFNTYQELHLHLLTAHGFVFQHNQTSVQHLQFKDACDLTDEWVVIERRLLDYTKDRFCLLTLRENKTQIQMWLREIDPQGDPVTLPFYVVSIPVAPSEINYRCKTRILPHHLEDLENVDDNVFQVTKKFLRRIAYDRKDGNIHFSVTFKFLNACLSESVNTEINWAPDAGRDCRRQPTFNLLGTDRFQHSEHKRSYNNGHHRGGNRKYNGGRNTQDATKGSSAATTKWRETHDAAGAKQSWREAQETASVETKRAYRWWKENQGADKVSRAAATKPAWGGYPRGSSTTHAERTPRPEQTKKFTRTAQSDEHAKRSDVAVQTKYEARVGASGSSISKDTSSNGQPSSGQPKTGSEEKKSISQAYRDRWMGRIKIPSENDDMAP